MITIKWLKYQHFDDTLSVKIVNNDDGQGQQNWLHTY